jgi:hypothetical protein
MNVGGDFILVYARDGTGSKIANAVSAEDKQKFIDAGEAVYRRQRPAARIRTHVAPTKAVRNARQGR